MSKHEGYSPAALAIARRMSDRGLTQGELAKRLDKSQSWVSQSLLGNAERTLRRMLINDSMDLDILLEVLDWGIDEMLSITRLDRSLPIPSEVKHLASVGPNRAIRDFGTVSAGEQAFTTNEHQYIEVPDFVLGAYNPDDCFALTVVGDSMTDEGARDNITEGSIAVFHEHLQPEVGDIVAAWLDDPEYGELRVLKVHRPDNGFITLHSFNHRVKPIVISPEADFRIFGVYLGAWNPGPRLRHRNGARDLKARVRHDLRKITDAND